MVLLLSPRTLDSVSSHLSYKETRVACTLCVCTRAPSPPPVLVCAIFPENSGLQMLLLLLLCDILILFDARLSSVCTNTHTHTH